MENNCFQTHNIVVKIIMKLELEEIDVLQLIMYLCLVVKSSLTFSLIREIKYYLAFLLAHYLGKNMTHIW